MFIGAHKGETLSPPIPFSPHHNAVISHHQHGGFTPVSPLPNRSEVMLCTIWDLIVQPIDGSGTFRGYGFTSFVVNIGPFR
jgi:hypothetical protein